MIMFFLLPGCIQEKETKYDVVEGNAKLYTMTIIKNTECQTEKQMEFLFYRLEKKEVDKCFYELYFLDCEKWKGNILPESCTLFSIQIK